VNERRRVAPQWDWLEDPAAALELYNAERRAFYEWDAAAMEWSKATRRLGSRGAELSDEDEKALAAIRERLDQAAQAYEIAKKRLHDAWAA